MVSIVLRYSEGVLLVTGGRGADPSGGVGILHFSLLEEVIVRVLARFSKWRAGAPG